MKYSLVVCYSRTGLTRKIAEEIAVACGSDLESIRDVRPRSGWLGYLRSGYEALRRKLPTIRPTSKNPLDYELVILGTPVWAGRVATPMRRYINQNRNRFSHIAAFCTMGEPGEDKALDELAALCGQKPVARLVLTTTEIEGGQYRDKVGSFARSLAPQRMR